MCVDLDNSTMQHCKRTIFRLSFSPAYDKFGLFGGLPPSSIFQSLVCLVPESISGNLHTCVARDRASWQRQRVIFICVTAEP